MNAKVSIVDYGNSNLISVSRGFRHCGAEVTMVDSADAILNAERLVIPGVGAFANSMEGLSERALVEPIIAFAKTARPLLGICIGMQMLLNSSEEFGVHQGLGLIGGKVCAIPKTAADGTPHRIPHIGWNRLALPPGREGWKGTILQDIEPGTSVYFVHSFTANPELEETRLADADYNARQISAAVQRDNIYGCQFHPEKSGTPGLQILRNFLSLT